MGLALHNPRELTFTPYQKSFNTVKIVDSRRFDQNLNPNG